MPKSPNYQNNFVARQPVFTRQGSLWGYELLFRNSETQNTAQIDCPEEASANVMVEGIGMAFPEGQTELKALINVPEGMFESGVLEYLPCKNCVLEILEDVNPTPELMSTLQQLHKRGYTLALDDYVGQEALAPLLPLVDIVKVDFLGMSPDQRAALTETLRSTGKLLLAEKVETHADVKQAHDLGYKFMQGYYFQKPEILKGRKVTPSMAARVHALWLLSNPELERRDLIEFFTRSPQLSYRLLKFANSAAFTTTKSISTLADACTFLGTDLLRQWLTAVLMADKQHRPCKQEVAIMGTVRATFLQNMAHKLSLPYGSQLFMLGLFSLLDALYDMPFEALLKNLPMDTQLQEALISRRGELGQWLILVEQLERGDITKAEATMNSLGVHPLGIALEAYQSAFRWARDTVF